MRVAVYIRVSTKHQDLAIQKEDLLAYCRYKRYKEIVIFEDKVSGTKTNRKALRSLMSKLDTFDVLLIWKLDRLFRSLKDLLNTLELLRTKKVALISLKESIDLGTKEGRLMLQIIGAVAEFEAEVIRERVSAGVQHHIKKHGCWGPKKATVNMKHVLSLHKSGMSQRKIAEMLDTHRTTVRRIIKRHDKT